MLFRITWFYLDFSVALTALFHSYSFYVHKYIRYGKGNLTRVYHPYILLYIDTLERPAAVRMACRSFMCTYHSVDSSSARYICRSETPLQPHCLSCFFTFTRRFDSCVNLLPRSGIEFSSSLLKLCAEVFFGVLWSFLQ